jgi:hypothetical protein
MRTRRAKRNFALSLHDLLHVPVAGIYLEDRFVGHRGAGIGKAN